MPGDSPVHLFVFMTQGMSLSAWRDLGMLEREMALYQALRPSLSGVTIVSYGGREEQGVVSTFPGIDVVSNSWNLPPRWYKKVLPGILRRRCRGLAIYKTNQMQGAKLALRAARKNAVPLVARCGYMLSDFVEKAEGSDSRQYRTARDLERMTFTKAAHCVVTTQGMRDTVLCYGVPQAKVSVVPNYVDTVLFSPNPENPARRNRIVFIGRLHEQKNPLELVRAVQGLDVEIDMVGQGPLLPQIQAEASRLGVSVSFHGNRPNADLPEIINAGACYVLPSHFEGHPKTLLEAMSCGAAVIGADRPGIREVIGHGETGLLCEPVAESLREAISTLVDNPTLCSSLGRAARQKIVSEVSLDRVKELELAVYRSCIQIDPSEKASAAAARDCS